METIDTLIVGASAAGLACAAQLSRRNLPYLIIEQQAQVAQAWRNHYERLHLHTNKSSSHLPFLKFPATTSKYPSRTQVIAYLEEYMKVMNISPRFHTTAKKITKGPERWKVETTRGEIYCKNLILCTGNTHTPRLIEKPGLDSFPGRMLHSSQYRNGEPFRAQNVLVIGFGNSAGEIAICLHEHGAFPALSVRGAVNVIPRDILGIPVLQIGILQSKMSPRLADKLNRPLIKILVGDIEKFGFKKLPYGPTEQIVKHHSIPLLDIGTMRLIKDGHIKVYGDIININGTEVTFEKGQKETFDAIIMATGYDTGLNKFIALDPLRQSDIKIPIGQRKFFGQHNLYFCGFYVAPTGMLREINIESGLIADTIKKRGKLQV